MKCYFPIPASDHGDELILWPPVGDATLEIPCGGCLGCRSTRATEWAHRAEHEASLYDHNCFLTLTYKDEELPKDGHLSPKHLQDFLKRLRAHHHRAHSAILRSPTAGMRYLAAGEYGTQHLRPHYHVLLFNCGFSDAHRVARDLTESKLLNQLWPFGQHRLGTLTGASANYVAQYTLKKLTEGHELANADGVALEPEFQRCSLKPALGTRWYEKFYRDLQHGYLVSNGTPGPIPRTYKRLMASNHPELYAALLANTQRSQKDKQRRASGADAYPPEHGRSNSNSRSHDLKRKQQLQQQADTRARRGSDGALIHQSRNRTFNPRTGDNQ